MKTKQPKSLGLRAFARVLGVAEAAIRQGIASGRVPPQCVGVRTTHSGRRWPVITDPDRAARYWRESRNPMMVRRSCPPPCERPAKAALRSKAKGKTSPPAPAEPDTGAIEAMLMDGKLPTIRQSQRVINAYKARMAKMEHDKAAGELVSRAEVMADITAMVVVARTKLMGIPSKLKQHNPVLTIDDLERVETIIRDVLTELADTPIHS